MCDEMRHHFPVFSLLQQNRLNLSALSSQGVQERLMVLFPQDVLLLSVDSKRLNIRYEVA